MATPRFIQVHFLTSYPAVLLNRDDAGLAKRITYGGTTRTRVSSQCLKRHWRTADDTWAIKHTGADLSVRTRDVFGYAIAPKLRERLPSVPEDVVAAAGLALSVALYGKKAEDPKKRQALLLGWREVDFLIERLVTLLSEPLTAKDAGSAVEALFKDREEKANLSAIRDVAGSLAAGVEAALFGRMVTSDPAANTDASVHVAHAFTVHEQESETDYFTVVDDLKQLDADEDSGSAGIFDTELSSGLFYGYVVVDVPLLVGNVTGVDPLQWDAKSTDRALAAIIIEHLIHLIATVSPGAKKGSTAPYAWAQTMLVELGTRQPRSLASAFEQPVRARTGESISRKAEDALYDRLGAFDRSYGTGEARACLSLSGSERGDVQGPLSIDALASWTANAIRNASA
ncbi:MAG: type I-E CRISPR-associated protein Cas7/Cse4/CasC [Gemmatimonadetes bacterium]|jgi:CRISPR system Cascade subunit CasC|nr:type I-E CRISPR-associated protein Cas7/Cse4/CasC [Gemmatimonadota bacterium]